MKIGKLIILLMGLLVSCVQPVITTNNSPTPKISSTVTPTPTSSSGVISSPVSFTPKRGFGEITGILDFNETQNINISIYDAITQKKLKSIKVLTSQKFIIDDIPILDKNGTDINFFIDGNTSDSRSLNKIISTKIFDSKLTDIGTITFVEKDKYFFYGEGIGVDFLIQDKNSLPLKDAIATDITGGKIFESKKINDEGKFYLMFYLSTVTFTSPRKIEIKFGNKIMTFYHNKEDYSGLHKITFVPNARTIYGYIFDSKDKSKTLSGLKVKVLDQDIAVRTDEYGRYELRGVPFDEVTIEIDDTLKVTFPKVTDSEERLLDDIYY
jgi:hypothetical protein